ncbi:hypothetical protein [Gallaecimonas sp. GXIMD4217]|uniref:hypothetical protein n=1 Tax=Gallaecimonas sp. GXIMD4217 TaxID=3131927 RepID=UPI00311ABF58
MFIRKAAVVAAVAGAVLASPAASAASSKFSAAVIGNAQDTAFLSAATDNAGTPLTSVIRTANKKDLLIGVSLEASLFTRTQVKGKGGDKDSASATAGIEVTVLVDGVEAWPGTVTFNKRTQDLSATFGGVLDSCTDTGGATDEFGNEIPDGTITLDECTFTDEDIDLALSTMSAHHFNFIMPDMEPGDHVVEVVTNIEESSSAGAGEAEAEAFVGKCSLSVMETQAINQEGGIVEI